MATHYYKALATCAMLKTEVKEAQTSRKAMEMCIQKIRNMLDLYKGHLINRIRFHIDKHHDEYCRKIRLMERRKRAQENKKKIAERESERCKELKDLKALVAQQNAQIEAMSLLLDARN